MNTASLNNLWNYLQGLPLTKSNWRWIVNKSMEKSASPTASKPHEDVAKYRISPKRKKLMGRLVINVKDYEGDERAQYLLSK